MLQANRIIFLFLFTCSLYLFLMVNKGYGFLNDAASLLFIYLFNMVNKGSESLKVASALFRPQSLNYTLFDQI